VANKDDDTKGTSTGHNGSSDVLIM